MEDFKKVVCIGKTKDVGMLFCEIAFSEGQLSVSGVEGPKRNGNAKGSCGQIIMDEWEIASFATGWDEDLVQRFREVWATWYLNDMQAGTPKQTAYLKANPQRGYIESKEALRVAGLDPDEGYSYGTQWLRVEVPEEVLEFLKSLPESTITPAWV